MRVILWVVLFTGFAGGVDGQALPQETLQVTLLGTGAPPPDRDQMGPAVLVEAGELKLLFDVGPGATSSIRAHGLNLGAIQTVFPTHLHVDHLVGLPDFWLTGHHRDRFGQRTEPVVVYGPVGAARMVAGLLDAYDEIARGWGLPDVALRLSAVEIRGPGVIS